MAIILPRYKKNSRYQQSSSKIGVAFPLNETNMFSGTVSQSEQNKANLLNVLLTNPGERVNLPDFGVGLKNLIFEQNVDIENLERKIARQVNRFSPDTRLLRVDVRRPSDEQEKISILIVYRNLTESVDDAVQVNFGDVITPEVYV
tara:strand:- start:1936 stop:2373 length:438 start_codon:yes stop_codon:yes gene_type:complete